MLKKLKNIDKGDIIFIMVLICLSMFGYIIHYLIFKDLHHILIFAVEDLAFLPIEVIVVSLILHRVISANDKKKKENKLYMVIEVFFSGKGYDILSTLADKDSKIELIQDDFIISDNWCKNTFKKRIENYEPELHLEKKDYENLLKILESEKNNIMRMIENPMLFEHETFSELLMALFHLYRELRLRKDIKNLSKEDEIHLKMDAQRAYLLLCIEWVEYLEHMRTHYPYLYNA